jgi:hypothetical protein
MLSPVSGNLNIYLKRIFYNKEKKGFPERTIEFDMGSNARAAKVGSELAEQGI